MKQLEPKVEELVEEGYWIDENNNKWKKNIVDYGLYLIAKETLINCKNCIDCYQLENCANCIDCKNCENCEDCEDCIDCCQLENCEKCIDCEYCIDCKNCENCENCKNYENLTNDKTDSFVKTITNESLDKHEGMKDDNDKLRWTLLPIKQLNEVVEVLEFGAKKYSVNNWQKVNPQRYKDAMFRHLIDYLSGDKNDKESGKSHLAHLICCALFLMWFDKKEKDK